MNDLHTTGMLALLVILLFLSAFFSGSETGMMAINRYRLRHLAKSGHRGARRVSTLLERPDRLIGVILLGNNFVNILASSIATVLAVRLYGEAGIVVATAGLTAFILIFGEVTPKTLAALHPERVAFPTSLILAPLLKVLYPLVWVLNTIANAFLRLLRVSPEAIASQPLSREELRTVVNEAGAMIPRRHQQMLVSILDLEQVTVDDIMVPRNEVVGVDLDDPPETIRQQLLNTQHTRIPVYEGNIDQVVGILHVRRVLHLLDEGKLTRERLHAAARAPYFVPGGTPLHTQLMNFQREKRRIGLVVDEYGDIQGLVTLEDILEEIVGEFTSDPSARTPDIVPQSDGTYLVEGSTTVRSLNRALGWRLPTDGPKTLNGLIIEYMETIPEPGTSLKLAGYPVEVVQTTGSAVKTVRVNPALAPRTANEETPGVGMADE